MDSSHPNEAGIVRTASGRETYAPDGHTSNIAAHHEYEATEEKHASPATSRTSSESSDSGRFAPVRSERAHEYSPPESDLTATTLTRRKTQGTINDENRTELRELYTTLSRKQSTMANPDDPSVDPGSDSFQLPKFLKMFRNQIEGAGHSMMQVGIAYKNLNIYGKGEALQLQKTVGNSFIIQDMFKSKKQHKHILRNFDGIVKSGEMLIVLGRPGSGCSTLLKTMCGELHGLEMDEESLVHYNGIPQKDMMKEFKGEVIYNQEVDKHFPHLTVGQTLEFAAATRTPSSRPMDMSRGEFVQYITRVVMAVVGLSHTYNTKVGNDFIRGVSGGERKRVSIAEMMLAGSPFAAWDNSTRGLDSGE